MNLGLHLTVLTKSTEQIPCVDPTVSKRGPELEFSVCVTVRHFEQR